MTPTRTGELILQRGLASAELVDAARRESRARGEPICSRLLTLGIEEGELASVLAERHGFPGVDLSHTAIPLDLLDLVPRVVAEGDLILPLSLDGGRIHLAMARPWDERVISEVRFVTGREVSPYVAVRGALLHALGEAYEDRARGATLWRGRACSADAPHLESVIAGVLLGEEVDEIPDAEIVIEVEEEVAPAPATSSRTRPLALVVDDEPEIRQLVERMLSSHGYQVALAVDGQDALDQAEALLPDLVLLDAMLPKVHGFDACRRIKAGPRTRRIPVVMMTAIYKGWRFAQDARDSYGASDYVEKPFRMEDLLQRMERALRDAAAPAAAPEGAEPHAALVARARELIGAGKAPEAIELLSDVVKRDPLLPDAQYQLGRALHASGDTFAAITALEHAVEASPGHLPALRALAALYEEGGFRRKAAEVLERALPAAPDDGVRAELRTDLMRLIA